MTAALLTAVVRKNSELDRRMIQSVRWPVRLISQPPIASPPTPPPGSRAPEDISVHANARASRAGIRSNDSRKITTKLAHDASSSPMAAAIAAGLMRWSSPTTGRSPGTASSSATPSAPISATVAIRRPTLIAGARGRMAHPTEVASMLTGTRAACEEARVVTTASAGPKSVRDAIMNRCDVDRRS